MGRFSCIVCGNKVIRYRKNQNPKGIYFCSPECRSEWQKAQKVTWYKKQTYQYTCSLCGKSIIAQNPKKKYCTDCVKMRTAYSAYKRYCERRKNTSPTFMEYLHHLIEVKSVKTEKVNEILKHVRKKKRSL